jgi:hypothetical protein
MLINNEGVGSKVGGDLSRWEMGVGLADTIANGATPYWIGR